MLRFDGHHEVGDALRGGVVAIGNFDGLHRGHQALFAQAKERAKERGVPSGVLTFEPHPVRVLAPRLAPPLILTLEEKVQGIEAAGIDVLVLQPFTRDFAKTPPEAFAKDLLLGSLQVSGVVVGPDFSFGHRGAGKVSDLERWLGEAGTTVDVVPAVKEGGLVCSSTKVREFVLAGRVDAARLLLGRPYGLKGRVVPGDGRGKRIGIPTANLKTERELLPKLGVYATRAVLEDGATYESVTNIGLRPTFRGEGVRIETHLFGFDGDLYDQEVEILFHRRLRDEQRFRDVEGLRAQVERDIEAAKAALREEPQ